MREGCGRRVTVFGRGQCSRILFGVLLLLVRGVRKGIRHVKKSVPFVPNSSLKPRLHDTTCCQPVVSYIRTFNRLSNPFDNRFNNRLYRVYSRLSNRLYNRFDNWLYRVNGVLRNRRRKKTTSGPADRGLRGKKGV